MKRIMLDPEEIAKTAFPGGRMPLATAKPNTLGGPWTNISDGSPAAIAAAQERADVRAKPALVAARKGKGR